TSFTVDQAAPELDVTLNPVTGDNTVNIQEAAGNVAVTGSVTGEFTTGDAVTLSVNGTEYAGTVAANGTFSINVAGSDLAADADRTIDVSVTTTDAAGNTSTATDSQSYTVDQAAPVFGNFSISEDLGSSGTDYITRDNTLSVSGSVTGAATGAFVTVDVMNGSQLVTTLIGQVQANGTFTTNTSGVLSSTGVAGTNYTFTASVTDPSGNTASESFGVVVDRQTTASTVGLTVASDSAAVDGITNDATPDFTGTAEAGATVGVFLDGELVGTAVANSSGQYTLAFADTGLDPLTNGTYTLTTITTDVAGNIKPSTQSTPFTVDTIVPTATITLADSALIAGETTLVTITFSEAVTGFAFSDLTTGNGTLSGLSAASTNPVTGAVTYTATLTPAVSTEATANVISLSTGYTDAAGNTGTVAASADYAVDTKVPTVASVSVSGPGIADGSGTLVTGQTVSFAFDISEAVRVAGIAGLVLNLSNGATASYNQSKSNSTTLTFDYTVLVDQVAGDIRVESVSANGAVITDLNGNPFDVDGFIVNPAGTLKIDGYTGTQGSETFRGTAGAETFIGLGGDDTYLVNNVDDQVIEAINGGTDTVRTSVDYMLMAGQEIEVLRASGTVGLRLTGNEFDNRIVGTSGNDVINGKAGADLLFGGLGDDDYYVDNVNDLVTEAANAGKDTVYTSVSYTLKAGQEIETLRGLGSTGLTLTGNEFGNKLVGTDGNDILNGKAGADTLFGGLGNDKYYVDNANDQVTEAAGEGSDIVYTSVSYALVAGQEIETLSFIGSKGLTLTGNELANTILGGAGKDVLVGGLGRDVLTGGAGSDTFTFQTLNDTATGTATRDIIQDFKIGTDHIDLFAIDANSKISGDQSFSFIGAGAFTKEAGQLHTIQSGGSTIVEGDVDGNGKADFQIVLRNVVDALHANDFLL
ncbi:Ig-like domain-containing protein, partial [Methylobacterium bullatum]|uniref:Ig-like domain-containing protein n=1 Tax=Methylobacterium bullatum TaxID=570505 RepID=UPI001EE17760